SAMSRAISRLEQRLGVQLLRRSTRSLGLTEAGQRYLEQSRHAFALLDEAERGLQGQREHLAGRIRISAPTTYGHHRLPQRLRDFAACYPQVEIELSIGNRNVDLVAEGFDMAIRAGELPDSGLVARPLESAAFRLVAAPAYVQAHGVPADIHALAAHQCLAFVMPSTGRVMPWLLREGERDVDWTPSATLKVADDPLGLVALARAGAGICQIYEFIAADDLRRGDLVEILPQTRGRTRRFSLLYAPHRQLSAASRALIETLTMNARTMAVGAT
ncbi:MAG TPA: LysR substrate-binding domain-containing protein, partial [Pseudoxanthomonas sp.]|nr:LysR substrate-binding domain-containing protein [Pseudoxanthomonas sp.]